MNKKFNFTYELIYEIKNLEGNVVNIINIPPTITCDFSVSRTYDAKINKATFKIYNLSRETSNQMAKDLYDLGKKDAHNIYFRVGYENSNYLPLVFVGQVLETQTIVEGLTEEITIITAQDTSLIQANAFSNISIEANSTYKDVYDRLINDIKKTAEELKEKIEIEDLDTDAIKELESLKLQRGKIFEGNTFNLLKTLFENNIYIDLNTIKYLNVGSLNKNDVVVLSADTGLLNIPQRANNVLVAKTILEPSINLGYTVELRLTNDSTYNQKQYKVFGVSHSGRIGKHIKNEATTEIQLGLFEITKLNL